MTRAIKWLGLILVAALAVIPATAGHYGEKCTETTQVCLDHMAQKLKSSGFVGVELDMDKNPEGLTVTRVIPGSPAESSGIQTGDILTALNGVQINKENEEALAKARKEWKPGQSVTYTIKRDGLDRQVTLTLAPMPADVMAKYIGMHMLEHASFDVAQSKEKEKEKEDKK